MEAAVTAHIAKSVELHHFLQCAALRSGLEGLSDTIGQRPSLCVISAVLPCAVQIAVPLVHAATAPLCQKVDQHNNFNQITLCPKVFLGAVLLKINFGQYAYCDITDPKLHFLAFVS